jgi:hypothetical protein
MAAAIISLIKLFASESSPTAVIFPSTTLRMIVSSSRLTFHLRRLNDVGRNLQEHG